MLSTKKLSMLLASLFVFVGCAGTKIPDIPVYRKLPFSEKALEVYTVSDKFRIVPDEEFAKLEPFLLSITPDGYAEIKKQWLKACLMLGTKCDTELQYIDDFIQELDAIFKEVYTKITP